MSVAYSPISGTHMDEGRLTTGPGVLNNQPIGSLVVCPMEIRVQFAGMIAAGGQTVARNAAAAKLNHTGTVLPVPSTGTVGPLHGTVLLLLPCY